MVVDPCIPEEALTINTEFVDSAFKNDPEAVAKWPGITVYDDVIIVGERQK